MLETKIIKNITRNEKCFICNNDGYVIKDLDDGNGLTQLTCDCCEIGNIETDSTRILEPVSKFFNIEKMLSENINDNNLKISQNGFFDKLKKLIKQ